VSWSELEWPELSPAFPEPHPTAPPPDRPGVPATVAERVHAAEVMRGIVVPLCFLVGGALVCAGAIVSAHARAAGLALLAAGMVVAFVVSAAATLRIGPTWQQRQQHWRLLRWQAEHRAWLARERAIYLASLTPDQHDAFRRALAAAGHRIA
jgi:hypothetical protein